MGTSTDAMLMYGYHLGSDDGGWLIEEVDEYGSIDYSRVEWLAEYSEDDEIDVVDLAEKRLLASVGFTETDWQAEGFYERQEAAEDRVGVAFESHCSDQVPMYVLCAAKYLAYRGDALPLDLGQLVARVADDGLDAKLSVALATLGITPKQKRPAWLLCSYWG